MLCGSCKKLPRAVTEPASGRTQEGLPGWDRLKLVMCSGCGSLLPPPNATDTMLRTLSRLARFGMIAGARPILEP
jgi:hypothetical protein